MSTSTDRISGIIDELINLLFLPDEYIHVEEQKEYIELYKKYNVPYFCENLLGNFQFKGGFDWNEFYISINNDILICQECHYNYILLLIYKILLHAHELITMYQNIDFDINNTDYIKFQIRKSLCDIINYIKAVTNNKSYSELSKKEYDTFITNVSKLSDSEFYLKYDILGINARIHKRINEVETKSINKNKIKSNPFSCLEECKRK